MQQQQREKDQSLPQTPPNLPQEIESGNYDHYAISKNQQHDINERMQLPALRRRSLDTTDADLEMHPKEFRPSKITFISGHLQHFSGSLLKYLFKDNNLPLWINALYHLYTARTYLFYYKSSTTATIRQLQQLTRIQGIHHLSLGLLSLLALKERRLSYERNALFVLTLNSVGRSWSHYHPYSYLQTLKQIGMSNISILLISAIALIKTIKRTKKFI